MRPRYSFSSRHTGQAKDPKNINKEKAKFPDVARKILQDADIILQVLDARFPEETRNKDLEEYCKNKDKKIIQVLNKADLTKQINPLEEIYTIVSCKQRRGIKKLRDTIKKTASKIKKEKVFVGVLGYPNLGKSSIINLLIGKKSAPTAPQAGFTKGLQKLKLTRNILLIDSPGVIPKYEYSTTEDKKIAKYTKVGARSYTQVKDPEQIVAELMKEFPNKIENNYKIQAQGDSEILIEELGKKLRFFKKGGIVDEDRTARLILKDWQEGKVKL